MQKHSGNILLLRQIKERSDRVKAVWPFFFDWEQAVVLVFKEMNKRRFFMRMVGEIQIKYFGRVAFHIVNSLYFPWQFCCHAAAVFNSSQITLHLQNVKPRVWGAESPSSFARIKNPQSGFLCYRAKLALKVIA